MGNQYSKKLTAEEEWQIVSLFSEGKIAKDISYRLGIPLHFVYWVREQFPLFARKYDDKH